MLQKKGINEKPKDSLWQCHGQLYAALLNSLHGNQFLVYFCRMDDCRPQLHVIFCQLHTHTRGHKWKVT